jgi:hypothetical protein
VRSRARRTCVESKEAHALFSPGTASWVVKGEVVVKERHRAENELLAPSSQPARGGSGHAGRQGDRPSLAAANLWNASRLPHLPEISQSRCLPWDSTESCAFSLTKRSVVCLEPELRGTVISWVHSQAAPALPELVLGRCC